MLDGLILNRYNDEEIDRLIVIHLNKMGLNAAVYCDCFEKDNLKNKPKTEWGVYITENGCRECKSDSILLQEQFDNWNHNEACKHDDGIAISHSIGNAYHIDALRSILIENKNKFPILLEKVLYNGSHCGDRIDLESVPDFFKEVELIIDCHFKNRGDKKILRDFASQMKNLITWSLKLRKPISF